MRFALGLEYDGSEFLGWQSQPGGGTVQDAVEEAVSYIAGTRLAVVAAGRTDRGVHATGQVVHFDTQVERPLNAWVRGVNAGLPRSVTVRWARPVGDGFHARYGARARTYRYVLVSRAVRPALFSRYLGWTHLPLDVDAMRRAAQHLTGEHDFSAFRSSMCQARTPVRTVYRLDVRQRGERFDVLIRANAFLHHMVRNVVGALVTVGTRKAPPDWVVEVLASRDRRRAPPTFSPAGLYLEGIEYADEWQLPVGACPDTELPAAC